MSSLGSVGLSSPSKEVMNVEFALVLVGDKPPTFERINPATSQAMLFTELGEQALRQGYSRCTVLILDANTRTFKAYQLGWAQDVQAYSLEKWGKESRYGVSRG